MTKYPEYLKFYLEEKINQDQLPQENLKICHSDQILLDILAYFINKYFPQIVKNYKFLKNIVDLNNPEKWYPEARKIKRTIYYHMGPTNSGKTHNAIKSLISARTGLYCAPLRLLAWEIQEKLLQNNIKCNLITGQERDLIPNATHISCTVEKTDIKNNFDCAVIDEIQMINDSVRGNAWTEAFLGIKAKEIHLCGDPRALKLISYLCQCTGDDLIKINYNRLGSLKVEEKVLKSLTDLKHGDCIIGFSKRKLLQIRKSISVKECGVIYGHLPPKTKKEQVYLFNNLDSNEGSLGIKYLCATDAIGLGLNLNIKRIIFSSLEKQINNQKITINQSDIKQIAGRAGRSTNTGYVTAFEEKDLHVIRESLKDVNQSVGKNEDHGMHTNILKDEILCYDFQNSLPETEIKVAYLFPPLEVLLEFASIYSRIFDQNLENIKFLDNECQNFGITSINHNQENFPFIKFRLTFSEAIKLFKLNSLLSSHFIFKDLSKFLIMSEYLELETISKYDLKTLFHFLNAPIRFSETTKFYHQLYLRQMNNDGVVKIPYEFDLITKQKIDSFSQQEKGLSPNTNSNKIDVIVLQYLEDVYNCLEIYIFLSHRFEISFVERTKGENLKNEIAKLIEYIIEEKEITNLSSTGKRGFKSEIFLKGQNKENKNKNFIFERLEERKTQSGLNEFTINFFI